MTMTLESLQGRVGDVDSHEMIPTPRFPEFFGKAGQRFLDLNSAMLQRLEQAFPEDENRITKDRPDKVEITETTVWENKGVGAPSHADMDRRPMVLDAMGIKRQLIFPTFGLFALSNALGGGFNGFAVATKEQIANGRDSLDAYNHWAGRLTQKYPDRLRIVGVLEASEPGLTPETLLKKTEELIATGVKAIMITAGSPPAGLSPADPRLDAFYAAFTKSNVALVFHPPSGAGFRKSDAWGIVPGVFQDLSFPVALHMAEETFLCAMTLGGVFERHPSLRVGFIETGGSWIGPLSERMDFGVLDSPKQNNLISRKPSEYLATNVRVSVLLGEPVEIWLKRYPFLKSVYCYSSDYPHLEGKPWSMKKFYERIAPFGDDVIEKFFVTNSLLVLPAAA